MVGVEIYKFSSNYERISANYTSFTYFFLYFQIFEIKLDKICSKINLRGGPTLNLVQILLEDRDREYFSEKEI